jgi:ATP-dependent exoDNAse (exonuclease V) alpha subunit
MMIALPRKVFESIKYTYSKETKGIKAETIGTFTQFPISIAYSVSIHKSQGMTLEKMNLNIGRGGFASGQTYVAISRCKTLEGIFLTKRIQKSDVFLDSRVKKFLESQNR